MPRTASPHEQLRSSDEPGTHATEMNVDFDVFSETHFDRVPKDGAQKSSKTQSLGRQKHDWDVDPAFFEKADKRYALCNPLLMSLERVKQAAEFMCHRAAYIELLTQLAAVCRTMNQVYVVAEHCRFELARRIGISEASLRKQFRFAYDQGWISEEPGAAFRFEETFFKAFGWKVSQHARDLYHLRGQKKPKAKDAPSKYDRTSRVHSSKNNYGNLRTLEGEKMPRPNTQANTTQPTSKRSKKERIAHLICSIVGEYFDGDVYEGLANKTAQAFVDNGCDESRAVARFCHVMCESIRSRSDSDNYRAYTLVGILGEDVDNWRLISRQSATKRTESYERNKCQSVTSQVANSNQALDGLDLDLEEHATSTILADLQPLTDDERHRLRVRMSADDWNRFGQELQRFEGRVVARDAFVAAWLADRYPTAMEEVLGHELGWLEDGRAQYLPDSQRQGSGHKGIII